METKSLSQNANLGAKTSDSGSLQVFGNRLPDKNRNLLDKMSPSAQRILAVAGAVLVFYGASMFLNPNKVGAQTQPTHNQDSSLAVAESNWGPIHLTADMESFNNCNRTLEEKKAANAPAKDIAKAYFNRACVEYGMGVKHGISELYEEALADFNEVIGLDPTNAPAYANRGYTNLALQRIKEATSDFDKAIELNPNLPKPYVGRGSALNILGSYKEVLAEFDKALKLEPNNVQAHIGKGDAFMGLNDYKKALKAFKRAAELDPKSVPALAGIGEALLALGKYDAAGKVFDEVIGTEPPQDIATEQTDDVQRGVTNENEYVKRNPPMARAYYGLSKVFKKLGLSPEQAERLRQEAFKRDPSLDSDNKRP